MSSEKSGASGVPHMSPDSFRANAMRAVDLIASYWQRLDGPPGEAPWPVMCDKQPGWLLTQLPGAAPERGGRRRGVGRDLRGS
jgi:hypothetical protein